ncbi:MAG TPA: glucosamine-6-phosphate deaminase [Myxococcaceae bacterium]|nr:glucosamine-6-phosphate deaminase [Myxococcaceae bacterium]
MAVADRVSAAVRAKPGLVLGLPTGRTPLGLYRELVARVRRGDLDLSSIQTFNLDEFVGLDAEEPGSFRAFMERHLFREVGLAPERIHFLDGKAPDLGAECARYEARLQDAGGVDLLILGLGVNGHLAFNEPGDALQASTHVVKLTRESRLANAPLFGDDPLKVPLQALTMGMASILQARALVLMAFGASKAEAVRGMLQGPVTPKLPASFLQLHPDVEVVLDRAAEAGGAGG